MELFKTHRLVFKISNLYSLKSPNVVIKRDYGKQKPKFKKAAVILSGSGHLDGTCMYEAIAAVINLYKCNLVPEFYAPKVLQGDVMNHQTACPDHESRCCLKEAARIARGQIKELCELRYCDFSCLIVPGGFGITKTLTSFQEDKTNFQINPDLMRVLEEFHDSRKPIGFICIAGILPARLFPYVKVTLGMKGKPELWPYQEVIDSACEMGADVEQRDVNGFTFDKQHMVFTTPAFLYNGTSAQVFDGISNMIQNLAKYSE